MKIQHTRNQFEFESFENVFQIIDINQWHCGKSSG